MKFFKAMMESRKGGGLSDHTKIILHSILIIIRFDILHAYRSSALANNIKEMNEAHQVAFESSNYIHIYFENFFKFRKFIN